MYGIDCITFIRYACFNKKEPPAGARGLFRVPLYGVIRKIHIYLITPC
nr:MAG TPA: hypothetical protein [Caudoviricetes sp.]